VVLQRPGRGGAVQLPRGFELTPDGGPSPGVPAELT
jgi:hypothetical protein